MTAGARVVVIGATGHTGTLVARELVRAGLPFLLTGRNAARLDRVAHEVGGATTQLVDVTRPDSLPPALKRGDVVINCAGPFSDLGEPVVEACIRVRAHYLDTTGEQCFMKRVLDGQDRAARVAGVVIVNGMAFEYAIGDCAAVLAAEGLARPLRSVDLFYSWRGGVAASSRGTRHSILHVIRAGGYTYRDGEWRRHRTAAESRTVQLGGRTRFAVSFPAGEILTVPRHVEVKAVRGWIVMGRLTAALLPRVAPLLPTAIRLAEPVIRWGLQRAREGPTPEQRHASRFEIRADAAGADGERRTVTAEGRDPYGLTARIVVHGARRLLEESGRIAGVLAPTQVLEADALRSSLEESGVAWRQRQEISG